MERELRDVELTDNLSVSMEPIRVSEAATNSLECIYQNRLQGLL